MSNLATAISFDIYRKTTTNKKRPELKWQMLRAVHTSFWFPVWGPFHLGGGLNDVRPFLAHTALMALISSRFRLDISLVMVATVTGLTGLLSSWITSRSKEAS